MRRNQWTISSECAAVVLNVDSITEVRWWEHPDFARRPFLEAAERVAFDVLDPALRSRGTASVQARELHDDAGFREPMRQLFLAEPAGRLMIPTLHEALERIAQSAPRRRTRSCDWANRWRPMCSRWPTPAASIAPARRSCRRSAPTLP
jgi:hypothetical protein